jgi:hypothetical protein
MVEFFGFRVYSQLEGVGHKVLEKVLPSPKDEAIEDGDSNLPTKRWRPILWGMGALPWATPKMPTS